MAEGLDSCLYASCIKRPSNVVAAVTGCFLRPGQRVLVTATLSQVSVWSSDDTDFDVAPLQVRQAPSAPSVSSSITASTY